MEEQNTSKLDQNIKPSSRHRLLPWGILALVCLIVIIVVELHHKPQSNNPVSVNSNASKTISPNEVTSESSLGKPLYTTKIPPGK